MPAATSLAPLPSQSATPTNAAPSAANRRHSARPIPFAPPVTTTILPASSIPPLHLLRLFALPARNRRAHPLYFPNSHLATDSLCTSSGPSAKRSVREFAHALA